jgi:hypothetical protein
LKTINAALKSSLGSDDVQNPDRVMRLAGTVNYPSSKKIERGHIAELVTLHIRKNPPVYTIEQLAGVAPRGQGRPGVTEEKLAPTTESFFKNVNALAQVNILKWVRALFGEKIRFYPNTGAWRIKSKDLGRNLEEDLSISQKGVYDFGTEQGRTPIQLVIDYGPKKSAFLETSAADAALWLCQQMGTPPEAIGWGADDTGDDFNNASAGQAGGGRC